MNQRKWAKGKPCQCRIPGHCNYNPETSVLCHIRLAGITGVGMKAPDSLAFIGCSECHDYFDGRKQSKEWTLDEITIMGYEAVFRTQVLWAKEND